MAGAIARIPADCQNYHDILKYSGKPENDDVMIFGFLEESEDSSSASSYNSGDNYDSGDFNEEDGDVNSCNDEEKKAFWKSQDQLLQATLCRSSSIESKIRHATKEALKELKMAGIRCVCRRPVTEGCRKCLQREIAGRLQSAGFNCAICKSKWLSSKEIPSGEHTYLEVVDNPSSKKGEVRVVIELNFKAEFLMARASQEYDQLTNRLPEVFVGKIERLRALINILCSSSKKCMKERKMHMAPWRKQKYMQAKWVGTRELQILAPMLPVLERLEQPPRPRGSMLTFDLLENLPGMHCTAIKVV